MENWKYKLNHFFKRLQKKRKNMHPGPTSGGWRSSPRFLHNEEKENQYWIVSQLYHYYTQLYSYAALCTTNENTRHPARYKRAEIKKIIIIRSLFYYWLEIFFANRDGDAVVLHMRNDYLNVTTKWIRICLSYFFTNHTRIYTFAFIDSDDILRYNVFYARQVTELEVFSRYKKYIKSIQLQSDFAALTVLKCKSTSCC